jgi:NAD(P) transhydrogenase subunit alpha
MTCVRKPQEQALSLGATFVETGVDARGKGGYARELTAEEKTKVAAVLTKHIQAADLIITTAAIPGRPSPKLISKAQVAGMKAGAVIVDLSAEGGGNCEDTRARRDGEVGQVTIVAPLNVPSLLGEDASELYAKNQYNLLALMMKDNIITIDWTTRSRQDRAHACGQDEATRRDRKQAAKPETRRGAKPGKAPPRKRVSRRRSTWTSRSSITGFVALYIFMLAAFAGWVIIGTCRRSCTRR